MRDPTASRLSAALRQVMPAEAPDDDDGLASWCVQMGLSPDGSPLAPMEAARRAHKQQLADEPVVKDTRPFWRREYARDI